MARLNLALVIVFFSAALSDMLIKDNEWYVWKNFHNKKYESDDEESLRYAIWNDNLKKIERHNADKTQSFTMAMNHLGDMVYIHFVRLFKNIVRHRIFKLYVILIMIQFSLTHCIRDAFMHKDH